MTERPLVSDIELDIQRQFAEKVKAFIDRPQSYHIVTLGCQMNERDSEIISGMLTEMGMSEEPVRENAELILYNTCCVRENAENRALGNVIWLKELKKVNPKLMICVGGCMTQESGMAAQMKAKYPFIDVIFGTHNMHRLPEYIYNYLVSGKPVVEILDTDGVIVEGAPEKRTSKFFAYINIMYGCNNFCSYCIVPYVRGRERSRSPEAVIDEAKRLQDTGVKEIMLLGQNVNSYMGGGGAFAELLYKLDSLDIPRIRFMTSHPKDISNELISAYSELKHLMPNLHLPVQSGNDEILALMNRRYSREKYLSVVYKLRAARPDIGISSDLIVGFPGETEAQFEDTLSLVNEARFDSAFTFIYSPRTGTKAAELQDNTPYALKSEWIQRLIARQQQISLEILEAQTGKAETVLVDSISSRDSTQVGGKTPRGHMVNFPGKPELIGSFQEVKILSAGRNTLRGELI